MHYRAHIVGQSQCLPLPAALVEVVLAAVGHVGEVDTDVVVTVEPLVLMVETFTWIKSRAKLRPN